MYTDFSGQQFDIAIEGDDHPFGWVVGYWDDVPVPVYAFTDGTLMVPAHMDPQWCDNGEPSGHWVEVFTGSTMLNGPVPAGTFPTHQSLRCSDTADLISTTATPEQWWASMLSEINGQHGHIVVDDDGHVLDPSRAFRVYVV